MVAILYLSNTVFGVRVKTAGSNENHHISVYTQPTHLILGTVKDTGSKDTGSIFYRTKNQMRELCAGGNTVIFFFSDPAVFAIFFTL